MTDLSIIIVSWNVAALLAECLDSIHSGGLKSEIILVDSASSDHTVEMVRTLYPQVKLLAQSENVGFTRGNNIGLQSASGRYLLLLNPDTEIVGDALAQMVAYMDAHPEVGILGPHTLNSDRSTQSSKRRFPTAALAFFESTWLQPYAPKRLLAHFYAEDVADTATAEVDWVQGSALLARRAVYEQIGGLDEGYVMYSEELDWCKRAKGAGWRVVYFGGAQIIHHGGKSTEQAAARKHIHFQQSKLRYFRKYHSAGLALALRLFLLLSYAAQIGIEGVKSLLGHKRALRQERMRAYWQVLRSGLKAN
ncbi:MAG: glycosyltransferase family 2 protein [Chloroflexi bacterium]|nr:glycosyltransferase family 2 protein [Chloroflexota bacterium]